MRWKQPSHSLSKCDHLGNTNQIPFKYTQNSSKKFIYSNYRSGLPGVRMVNSKPGVSQFSEGSELLLLLRFSMFMVSKSSSQ